MTPLVTLEADRCVHARIETASCQLCVDVCPRRAWHLDDEGLYLSLADCDGCALCAAACPTRAIDAPIGRVVRWRLKGRPVLLAACEQALPEGGAGVLTCLHAVALADLLRHWRLGERIWLVTTAECASCPRAGAASFTSRIEHVNRLLEARGEALIQVKRLPLTRWRHVREAAADATVARRGFLQRLMRAPRAGPCPARPPRGCKKHLGRPGVFLESRPATVLQEEPAHVGRAEERAPPGHYLPGPGPLPWTLRLDPQACVACHACLRVCPEQALQLEPGPAGAPGQSSLHLEHARCTGCGLCVDVCEHQSIRVEVWAEPERARIPLRDAVCRRCGAPFQMPAERADSSDLCWVCTRNRSAPRLYQVMDAA